MTSCNFLGGSLYVVTAFIMMLLMVCLIRDKGTPTSLYHNLSYFHNGVINGMLN